MNYSFESSLKGKVCLITGGTKGIGREAAIQLLKMGTKVAIAARNQNELSETVKQFKEISPDIIGIQADLASLQDIKAMVKTVTDQYGPIDILINSAGTNIRTKAEEVTEEDWDTVMNVNLKGTFFCIQEVAKVMDKNKTSKIINISSQYGHIGSANRVTYCASKGGLELMTKSLAIEWAPHILVNNVAPTFIETELTQVLFEDEKTNKEILDKMPLGRVGHVQDVTGAILYLASDLSNMVTGTSLLVDGGWTAE